MKVLRYSHTSVDDWDYEEVMRQVSNMLVSNEIPEKNVFQIEFIRKTTENQEFLLEAVVILKF